MGIPPSKPTHSSNDFELCIRSSKELEHLLETEFGATGNGLHHEKITVVTNQLTPIMIKNMRYIATIRNRLVHEYDFNSLPDRAGFITSFDSSCHEIKTIVKRRLGKQETGSSCIVS